MSAPVQVVYCEACGKPPEYCEFNSDYETRCKPWILKHCPELIGVSAEAAATLLASLSLGGGGGGAAAAGGVTSSAAADGAKAEGGAAAAGGGAAAVEGGGAAAAAAPAPAPAKQKKEKEPPAVLVTLSQRNKRKYVTTVYGLDLLGVKLADAAKAMAKKFSCGCSVTKNPQGKDEIDIQGDFKEEVVDLILDQASWGIPKESIYFVDGKTKSKAR